MKFGIGLVSVYSFVQSFLFLFRAFIPVFSNYLIDAYSLLSLFIIPIVFGILFFYTGYGLWEDRRWGYYIGVMSFVSIAVIEFVKFCNIMGIFAGIFHSLIGIYIFYELFIQKI